jgi:osmoprotectant transport system substrate-binding protein
MQKRRLLAAAVVAGGLVLAGCGGSDGSGSSLGNSTKGGPITISGQNFTEATIVANIYANVLRTHGYEPSLKLVGTRDVYMATFPKTIDVVPEYVGGIVDFLIAQDKGPKAPLPTSNDPNTVISQGKPELDKAGITLLNPSEATDSNAFFVTKKYSLENNVTKLSDLKGKSVVLAAAPDCEGRLDCSGGLEDTYGIKITKILPLGFATQQTYDSVKSDESQLGETSTTDATLANQDLVLLQDDKLVQPAQNLVPAISSEFLKAHPDIAGTLNAIMAKLTTRELTGLNFDVTVNRQSPQAVAQQWVEDAGL